MAIDLDQSRSIQIKMDSLDIELIRYQINLPFDVRYEGPKELERMV